MLMCEEGWERAPATIIDASGMSDGTLRYLACKCQALFSAIRKGLFSAIRKGFFP
jgi:hypothetical protein